MADIFSTALNGLNASHLRAATAANNLANMNTPGYRAQRANTSDVPGGGAAATSVSARSTQGALKPTGTPLDLAIEGNGFFQVVDNQGNPGFTRDGSFRPDENGHLVNSHGFRLDPNIQVPQNATEVSVGPEGNVSARLAEGTNVNAGQIELAQFSNPDGLSREGGNLLTQTGASGIPQVDNPGQNGLGTIQSGFLEMSNVDIAEEAVNLRLEENMTKANAAVVRTADEMTKSVLDIKA